MSSTVVVCYRTHPEAAEQNARLVAAVRAALAESDPGRAAGDQLARAAGEVDRVGAQLADLARGRLDVAVRGGGRRGHRLGRGPGLRGEEDDRDLGLARGVGLADVEAVRAAVHA